MTCPSPGLLPPTGQFRESGGPPDGIAEEAVGRLGASGYLALRELTCQPSGPAIVLRGCVPTYYLKQVALALLLEIEGAPAIQDQVEVKRPSGSTASRAGA